MRTAIKVMVKYTLSISWRNSEYIGSETSPRCCSCSHFRRLLVHPQLFHVYKCEDDEIQHVLCLGCNFQVGTPPFSNNPERGSVVPCDLGLRAIIERKLRGGTSNDIQQLKLIMDAYRNVSAVYVPSIWATVWPNKCTFPMNGKAWSYERQL